MDKKNAPLIPETIVVELKEENKNATAKGDNFGDYSVQLDEPLLIEEGDQVSIKSVFIDSNIPETGLVEVKPEKVGDRFLDCSVETGFYLMNIPSSLETEFKIKTPANVDAQRLVLSKVYDPLLATDPANRANLHEDAGRGFTPSDINAAPPGTATQRQAALNSRMDGKPYVAMRVEKHHPNDPTTHNFNVSSLSIAFDNQNLVPGLDQNDPKQLLNFGYHINYFPAGTAGERNADELDTRALHIRLQGQPSGLINSFIQKHVKQQIFHDEDGNTRQTMVLTLGSGYNDPNSGLADIFTGSTLQLPFRTNDVRPYIHFDFPKTGSNYFPVFLDDKARQNSPGLDIARGGQVDVSPFSLLPITRRTDFKLECKKYVPDELAKIITQKMSKVDSQGPINADASFLSNNGVLATSRGLILNQNTHLTEANLKAGNGASPADRSGDTYNLAGITTPVVFARTLQTDPTQEDEKPELIQIGTDNIVDIFRMNDMNTASLNYIIGSQNFAVEYDDTQQKFSFASLHTPLYDISDGTSGQSQIRQYLRATGGAINNPVLPNGVAGNTGLTPPPIPARNSNTRFWVNKYSGVYISSLSPPSLWYDSGMNFNSSSILTGVSQATLCKDRNGQTMAVHGVPFNLVDGVNTTGDFDGVGAIVQKIPPHFVSATGHPLPSDNKVKPLNSTFDGNGAVNGPDDYAGQYQIYDVALSVAQSQTENALPPSYLSANEDRQVSIFAKDHISDNEYQQVDNPYYKVEIKSKLKNNIEGDPNKNQFVSSIISKYYSSGNYTSAYNEGSIVYTHKGMPEMLDTFNVRILDHTGKLATDISLNNTVFLEVVKANMN